MLKYFTNNITKYFKIKTFSYQNRVENKKGRVLI